MNIKVDSTLVNSIVNINSIIEDVYKQNVTVSYSAIKMVNKFIGRIESVLERMKLIHTNYYAHQSIDKVIDDISYIYDFIVLNYKYKEGTLAANVINSILDILSETIVEINNSYSTPQYVDKDALASEIERKFFV